MAITNHSDKKDCNPEKQEEVLHTALKKFGFLFPESEEEIGQFEEIFGSTDVELPSSLAEGDFILQNVSKEDTCPHPSAKIIPIKKTVTPFDYYKRTLLAAEIVNELHLEMTLGHLKLQKLIYLSQRTECMDLPVNFLKQAMGPYDPQMMRSIDKQLVIKKWFQFAPGEKLKYKPLDKSGQHKPDFSKYFQREKDKVQWLIDTFRKVKSDRVEIIATLFACWEELLKEKLETNEQNLVERFFAWSIFKQKFNVQDVKKEIPWMQANNLYPKDICNH